MTSKEMLDLCKKLFIYDKKKGKLFKLKDPTKEAGTFDAYGYRNVSILGRKYKAHRIV